MKRTILLALMAVVVILCSCKKESKEDPVTPTPTPTPESDSVNFQFRYYVSVDMLNYIDQKLYVTLPGDTEKLLTLPQPQAIDTVIDINMDKAIVFEYGSERAVLPYDSFKVYVLDFHAKKGICTFRPQCTPNESEKPEEMTWVKGYDYFINGVRAKEGQTEISLHRGVCTNPDTLNRFINYLYKNPITINLK